MRIAFFDTKPYDRGAFEAISGEYPFRIDYFESRLTPATAKLAATTPTHFPCMSIP